MFDAIRRHFSIGVLLGAVILNIAGCQSTGGGAGTQGRTKAPAEDAKPATPADRSVADLGESLRDPDLTARLAAVEELGHRAAASPDAVALLTGALADPEPLVRRFAAGGLAAVPAPSAATVLALGKLLRDAELDPRESAARTLAVLSPHAPAEAVGDLGPMLAAAASDKEESVRALAVEALGGLGARGTRTVPAIKPALERALSDPSERVRGAAAASVGELGAVVPGTVVLLTKALGDPSHEVRKQAVVVLEKWGPDAAPATRAIVRLLHGKEIYLRVFAADALTAIGPGARAALPDLKAMVARGWKDLENSPEFEAKQLPDAVARAIASIQAGAPPKAQKTQKLPKTP